MSRSASPEAACQLDSRYWKITTSDGNVEEVHGPGVVGASPPSCWGEQSEGGAAETSCSPCVCVQESFR